MLLIEDTVNTLTFSYINFSTFLSLSFNESSFTTLSNPSSSPFHAIHASSYHTSLLGSSSNSLCVEYSKEIQRVEVEAFRGSKVRYELGSEEMVSGVMRREQHVVRVRRELLVSCMTCPLCNKLLRDATTVSECLHTFCRKCIMKKFTDEELESCPICHIDLGVVPAEKLRPDHNLQDVRSKIFPLSKTLNPNSSPPPLPIRRKERSLSSLSAPRVSSRGRRTKFSRRWKNDAFTPGKKRLKNDDFALGKRKRKNEKMKVSFEEEKKQNNLDPETSTSKEKAINDTETELWKPLNCLLEAATRSKTLKPLIKQEPHFPNPNHSTPNPNNNDLNTPINNKSPLNNPKEEKRTLNSNPNINTNDDNDNNNFNDDNVGPSNLILSRGKRVIRRKNKSVKSGEKMMRERRLGPVWFSLVSTTNREGGGMLPQLSSNYLRIKDGDLTVLSIQKYITQKLNLISEEEVEIVCKGQAVGPTTTLHNLIDLWIRSETSNQRTHTMVGTPAKDFIMVLAYRNRVKENLTPSANVVS